METTIKPKAQKTRGAEWYRGAVEIERGMKSRLYLVLGGKLFESRSKAMTAAKRYIKEHRDELLTRFEA